MSRHRAHILIIVLLLAGCARSAPQTDVSALRGAPSTTDLAAEPGASPGSETGTEPGASPGAEPGASLGAEPGGASVAAVPADLLPQPDTRYAYRLSDGAMAHEYYTRDGERLIGSYNGNVYVT